MKPPRDMVVDHINGNGLDNRRCNLPICMQAENALNRRPDAGAGTSYCGVTHRGDEYGARVKYRGPSHHLGRYDTAIEGAKIRDRKALKPYAHSPRRNIPPARVTQQFSMLSVMALS